MKILICPDKFKESLPAETVAEHIKNGIHKVFNNAEVVTIPMADGGEGSVGAIITATKGTIERVIVHDPLMRKIESFYGITGDKKTAVIEMAAASGLALLKPEERDPMVTTTYGTGEIIRKALDRGCERIIIGIGGSATVEGGVGMGRALGIRFLDKEGREVDQGGGYIGLIATIDKSNLDRRLQNCTITVAGDVTNLLTGDEGAAHVFGPQKGADTHQVEILDKNLAHLGRLIKSQLNINVESMPGGGAAGGLGAGIVAFLGGEIKKGFEVISEIVKLEDHIKQCDLVLTGEGKIDHQTAYGKTLAGIAAIALKYDKPVIAFTGSLERGYESLYSNGISAIIPIADKPMLLEESMKNAGLLLERASETALRLIEIGKILKNKN